LLPERRSHDLLRVRSGRPAYTAMSSSPRTNAKPMALQTSAPRLAVRRGGTNVTARVEKAFGDRESA